MTGRKQKNCMQTQEHGRTRTLEKIRSLNDALRRAEGNPDKKGASAPLIFSAFAVRVPQTRASILQDVQMTPIDQAHADMQADPDNDAARMQFYERVASSELFLVLAGDAGNDTAMPALFEVEACRYALVFDTQERMVEFTDTPTPFLAVSGRGVVAMLTGRDIGLGLNLGVAPSSTLLPAESVEWLENTMGEGPEPEDARPTAVYGPGNLPDQLIRAFDAKLATMAGLARAAYLAQMDYDNRARAHVLAFVDAIEPAEREMARAIAESLRFSGIEAGALDVVFLKSSDPICAQLAKVALRFDLPEPETVVVPEPVAPGSDPEHPPILR